MKFDLHDIRVHLHHITEKECLVSLDGNKAKAVWVPYSRSEPDAALSSIGSWLMLALLPLGVIVAVGLIAIADIGPQAVDQGDAPSAISREKSP
jgi:hypothetical protein